MEESYSLERIPLNPPVIKPVEKGTMRPMWSIMIPVYNCINYIENTLISVLNQDLGPERMEIIVVDDCSTDGDVSALVNRIGKGRVVYFKQAQNVGQFRNFETCINLSKGYYIHILHGDDEILDGFYKEIESLFNTYPEVGAAFTNYQYIDSKGETIWNNYKLTETKGVLNNWLTTIAENQRLQFCCNVVKRTTYEKLGSFYGLECVEDWLMWVRIAANFPVAYSPETLASYRVFDTNVTGVNLISGKFFNNSLKCIELFREYLPKNEVEKTIKIAHKNLAENYARLSHRIYHDLNDTKAACRNSISCLKLKLNLVTIKFALLLFIKIIFRYKEIKKIKGKLSLNIKSITFIYHFIN